MADFHPKIGAAGMASARACTRIFFREMKLEGSFVKILGLENFSPYATLQG